MDWFMSFILCGLLVQLSVAPPVTKDKTEEEHKGPDKFEIEAMEYHRYLREVVETLESDPDFRAKLENAGQSDIMSGKIAKELEFVNHKVRSSLDELKRAELERLRHLAIKENQLNNGLDLKHLKIAQHIDHTNTHSFEIDDLKKLITKATEDLAEADRRRRQHFKEYEMQKKYEQEQKLKAMNEEEKKKYVQELEEMREKHKKHEPLHHPGSKQQLEEVWEKQDHMDSQDFDLQKFFYFHDIDGNGVWDQNEVKALFLKDLDKLYADGAPEHDLVEREEEMERMREHVFNEADLNKDGLISYQEFLEQTKKPNFQQDPGWEALDEQQIYSQEEYEAYEKLRRKEMQMPNANKISQYEENVIAHNQQLPPQHGSPSGYPQAGDNSIPPQQYQYQGQLVQQQYHPQQVQVPQQHYQGQVPIQQQQQQQQQQQHYNQVPQQQYQGQPQGGQFHGQLQSNQIPVQHQQQQQQIPQQHQQQQQILQQHQQQQQISQQHQQQQQIPQQQQHMQQQQPQYQNQQQSQHPNVQAQIPQQQQQQQNIPNQIPQQQNTLNQIPQQQINGKINAKS